MNIDRRARARGMAVLYMDGRRLYCMLRWVRIGIQVVLAHVLLLVLEDAEVEGEAAGVICLSTDSTTLCTISCRFSVAEIPLLVVLLEAMTAVVVVVLYRHGLQHAASSVHLYLRLSTITIT